MRCARPIVLAALAAAFWPQAALGDDEPRATVQDKVIRAAEKYLGKPYVFGGRDGRPGCRSGKRRVRCKPGIDCQSLIFFAYEDVLGTPWTRFSVMPSVSVKRRELGIPIQGLDGVLARDLDASLLRKGDVLFFLLKGYNLTNDKPLLVRGEDRYGVWHTALVHSTEGGREQIIHAKPGHEVVIEDLGAVEFDALYVVRWPTTSR